MNVNYSRDAIRDLLESVGHPLPRHDIMLRLLWAAGADPAVYRTIDDVRDGRIAGNALEFSDNLRAMRADGDLVLLRTTEWRRILGLRFNPDIRINSGGSYRYATRAQHERWQAETDHPAQILAQLQTRLDPDGVLTYASVARSDLAVLFKLAVEGARLHPSPAASSGPKPDSGMTADRIAEIRSKAASEFRDWEWADTVIDELLREVERLSSFSTGSS
ncbi:hypothetical protein [Streptomyces ehimensis]|uniref:GPP34 family phosphoprotein n=1 Tax=Streptomyces ehimensis TaxID=68195 RepID=A0ABV9BCN7_9ACTN